MAAFAVRPRPVPDSKAEKVLARLSLCSNGISDAGRRLSQKLCNTVMDVTRRGFMAVAQGRVRGGVPCTQKGQS